MQFRLDNVERHDPVLYDLLRREERRQESTLELIASESIQSPSLLEIDACCFNNKTAVGKIGDQHMAGSELVDELMRLTAERACELYGAEHANIQPYSGATANYSVYAACLNPGDTVLALSPDQGGHATHGSSGSYTSRLYRFAFYNLDQETLLIDYDDLERKAGLLHPKLIIAGSSTYSQVIDCERISEIAKRSGAYFLMDMAHYTGVIAAGIMPSPVPFADFVTGSTTKTICGPRSGFILCKEKYADLLDGAVYPGVVASMHLQVMAGMAHAFLFARTGEFRQTMQRTVLNAQTLAGELQARGFPILTNGTKCHLLVADMRARGIDARRFVRILDSIHISTNPVPIPYDPSPVRNGLRLGTTTCTQRGMGPEQMRVIADILDRAARFSEDAAKLNACAAEVRMLTGAFRLYGDFDAATPKARFSGRS